MEYFWHPLQRIALEGSVSSPAFAFAFPLVIPKDLSGIDFVGALHRRIRSESAIHLSNSPSDQ
jgi:hypothetical protein